MVRDDPDAAVQREAVDAIGEFPENVSLPRLEKIARTHPSADVRRAAIDALGNHDPDRVAPILESLIDPARKQKP
jgi:HEAT repeat protein